MRVRSMIDSLGDGLVVVLHFVISLNSLGVRRRAGILICLAAATGCIMFMLGFRSRWSRLRLCV